jgi:hypothetical protein
MVSKDSVGKDDAKGASEGIGEGIGKGKGKGKGNGKIVGPSKTQGAESIAGLASGH